MRIEAYNQVSQLYKAQNTSKAAKAYGNNSIYSSYDQMEISQTGRDYQVAKQAVAGTSGIREDKIAQLKEQVANGTYKVSAEDFASKLLEKYDSII